MLQGAKLSYLPGVPTVLSTNVSGVPAAADLAKASDLVVLVLGTDLGVACENRDAVNITFSDGQLALVHAVTAATTKPVVVVTLTAVPLDLTPLLDNPQVGAILHAGQPSVQTLGIGDILFGAVSPSGRAVQTVYPESYQNEVSPFDFNMRPGPSKWPRPDSPGPCMVRNTRAHTNVHCVNCQPPSNLSSFRESRAPPCRTVCERASSH